MLLIFAGRGAVVPQNPTVTNHLLIENGFYLLLGNNLFLALDRPVGGPVGPSRFRSVAVAWLDPYRSHAESL